MKHSNSELKALLNTNASIEAIQANSRQIIIDSLNFEGLTPKQRQVVERICTGILVPLSVTIKTSDQSVDQSQKRKGIFSHISNIAVSLLIIILSILIYHEIVPLGMLNLLAFLTLYLTVNSLLLYRISEKTKERKNEAKLIITSTFDEMENSINSLIDSIECIIEEFRKLNQESIPTLDPLMGSHLEILKWIQRLYNKAAHIEKMNVEQFREDISYILESFDYELKPYSPEESENFSIEHVNMEKKEPNTVIPVIYYCRGEEKEVVLKGRAFLPK